MEEKDLVSLGLTAKGDRLKLQAFCNQKNYSEEREQKIAKIKEILDSGKGKRAKKRGVSNTSKAENDSVSKSKVAKIATLKFEFGWKHWRTGRGYVQQKKNNGGGTRSFNVPRHASLNDCQQIALNLFFPNGNSPVGSADNMCIAMGNFSGELIMFMFGGKPLEFTCEKYKQLTGFATPRLYLLTRHEDEFEQDNPSEDDLMTPTFEENAARLPTSYSDGENDGRNETSREPQEHSSCPLRENDGLIGTSTERQRYFNDLERAVKASLEEDQEKEKRREERTENLDLQVKMAKEEAERLESLRQRRESRVPLEPTSNSVWVSVRHCTLGVIIRAFDFRGTVSGVYDWVGSLSPTPEHFRLISFPSSTLYPEDPIATAKRTILNMTVADEPMPLSRDENDVHFLDGEGFEGANDNTLPDAEDEMSQLPPSPDNQSTYEVEPVNNSPPVQLLEDENITNSDIIQSLEDKRIKQFCALDSSRMVIINRYDVVKELLSLYKDENILRSKLSVSFLDETALGDGVLREVFSTFWDCFLARFCEGDKQFIFTPRPSLSDEDYLALGRIITHQFVLTGTFPVQVAEAQIIQTLFGKVSEECLVSSFLQLLPERERQILIRTNTDGPFPTDAIVDILSEYNATSYPTASSLPGIIKQVSKSEMIHKPFYLLGKIGQGMGDFWRDITKDEIEETYRRTTPNTTNVIASLDCVVADKKEERVAGWLVRYLKAAETKKLCRFLRFCTACNIVLPNKKISVRFENMSEAAMRPKAMTCFCSLVLPKGYNSFAHFSANLDYYFTNTTLWDLMD